MKNKALQDIEYILHCLVGIAEEYVEHEEYALKIPYDSNYVAIQENTMGNVLVSCPNGRTYNLTCALRNASLDQFKLLPESHQALLNKLDMRLEESLLQSELEPVYDKEIAAITKYTMNENFRAINAVLRGNKVNESVFGIKRIVIDSLLAISGINKYKGKASVLEEEVEPAAATLYRGVGVLPPGMLAEMFIHQGLQRVTGFASFSDIQGGCKGFVEGLSNSQHFRIILENSDGKKSIAPISMLPAEREVVISPGTYLKFTGFKKNISTGTLDIFASVAGAAEAKAKAKETDHYLSETALCVAYEEHLRKPYKNAVHAIENGIPRPNHALAHHVRVLSLIKPVIDYFSKHAADKNVRESCLALSHKEIELIRILAAFARTGREGEEGFFERRVLYQEYQAASANNLTQFMKSHLSLSETEVQDYADILQNMGNPPLPERSDLTFAAEFERRCYRKNLIDHIITLAHKLDLPRCYKKDEYDSSVSMYRAGNFISETELQKRDFLDLERVSHDMLVFTQLDRSNFISANTNVFICEDLCKLAINLNRADPYMRPSLLTMDSRERYQEIVEKKSYNLLKSIHDFSKFLVSMYDLSDKKLDINDFKIITKQLINSITDISEFNVIRSWSDDEQKILREMAYYQVKNDNPDFSGVLMILKLDFLKEDAGKINDIVAQAIKLIKTGSQLKQLLDFPIISDQHKKDLLNMAGEHYGNLIFKFADLKALLQISDLDVLKRELIFKAALSYFANCHFMEMNDVKELFSIIDLNAEQKVSLISMTLSKLNINSSSFNDIEEIINLIIVSDLNKKQKALCIDIAFSKLPINRLSSQDIDKVINLISVSHFNEDDRKSLVFALTDRVIVKFKLLKHIFKNLNILTDEEKEIIVSKIEAENFKFVTIDDLIDDGILSVLDLNPERREKLINSVFGNTSVGLKRWADALNMSAITDTEKQKICEMIVDGNEGLLPDIECLEIFFQSQYWPNWNPDVKNNLFNRLSDPTVIIYFMHNELGSIMRFLQGWTEDQQKEIAQTHVLKNFQSLIDKARHPTDFLVQLSSAPNALKAIAIEFYGVNELINKLYDARDEKGFSENKTDLICFINYILQETKPIKDNSSEPVFKSETLDQIKKILPHAAPRAVNGSQFFQLNQSGGKLNQSGGKEHLQKHVNAAKAWLCYDQCKKIY